MIQLGSGAASFAGGLIVEKAADGTLLHYNWVGYMSIFFMVIGIILGKYVKPVEIQKQIEPTIAGFSSLRKT
jgi:hypothetical protein